MARKTWSAPLALLAAVALAGNGWAGEPAATRSIGFRGDGSGHFAGATPPTKISETENLRWKTTPGQGCGAVLIVGDRLFVQAAPNALVCLDKASGKELWRREHHAGNLPAASQAAQLDGIMDQIGAFHRLAQQHRAPGNDVVKEAEAKLPKDILRQIPGASISGYGNGGVYLICMTPCSDGQTVVAVFPTGVAVAYDQQGQWLWSSDVRPPAVRPKDVPQGKWRPTQGFLSTCPVFTEDGIVIAVWGMWVVALEAKTGKALWQKAVDFSNASPVVGRIGGESFVATGDGHILRVRDGQLAFADPIGGHGDSPPSPVFANGVFYWVSHAVRITGGATPSGEMLWDLAGPTLCGITGFGVKEQKRTGPGDMTSPVLVGDRLLHYNQRQMIVTLDAATGKEIGQRRATRPQPGVRALAGGVTKNWAYGGLAVAGEHLIVIHDNGIVKFIPLNDPAAPVFGNALPDDVYAQPAVEGSSLYLRSLNALWRFDRPATEGQSKP